MVASEATMDMEPPLQDTFFCPTDGIGKWVGSSQAWSKPWHEPFWYVR